MNRLGREKGAARDPEQSRDQGQPEEIRVTDRRRINIDGETRGDVEDRAPNLKPTYVEELERRTQAAEQKLVEVQSRFDQLRSQLQRETDETRQRLNRAADERAEREKINFIRSLLPVVDNLHRAIEAGEQGGSLASVLAGVRGTANSFEAALAAAGVQPLEAVGKPFDPERHEAVDTIEVAPEEDGIITAEYSRGYQIGDKLLLPARVQVGRARPEALPEALSDAKRAAE
jgi:molecular chaperone GrpE